MSTRVSLTEVRSTAGAPRYAVGDVIAAKYRLERVLGEGGMGSVWLAKNLVLDVDVAIKVALGAGATGETRGRLLREAQTAARLQHPSIVRIYDFGETSLGDPFIVMEVVRGESLSALIERRGRLTAVEAVQLLLPIASALSTAHRKGIVHRDVKPSNIIVMSQGRGEVLPKLVDFGIAKVDEPLAPRAPTGVGAWMGSLDYMAPEQVRARLDVDERVDVWALGVVLYEVVAGSPPFAGVTASATLSEILVDDPRPLTDHGAGDPALWAILELALKKRREERWTSVRAMGRALARWAHGLGVETDASGTSLARHWLSEGDETPTSPPPSLEAKAPPVSTLPRTAETAWAAVCAEPLVPASALRRRLRWSVVAACVISCVTTWLVTRAYFTQRFGAAPAAAHAPAKRVDGAARRVDD